MPLTTGNLNINYARIQAEDGLFADDRIFNILDSDTVSRISLTTMSTKKLFYALFLVVAGLWTLSGCSGDGDTTSLQINIFATGNVIGEIEPCG